MNLFHGTCPCSRVGNKNQHLHHYLNNKINRDLNQTLGFPAHLNPNCGEFNPSAIKFNSSAIQINSIVLPKLIPRGQSIQSTIYTRTFLSSVVSFAYTFDKLE